MNDELTLDKWPNCPIPDCPNKICLRLRSDKCCPHTVGVPLNWGNELTAEQRDKAVDEIEEEWRDRHVVRRAQ